MTRTMRLAMWAMLPAMVQAGVAQKQVTGPQTALTIYNQNFALVRTPVDLDLKAGTTEVTKTDVTTQVEPDSVVLRDPVGKQPIHIVEQNYDGSLRVQAQMLAKFEGRTIDFVVPSANGEQKVVQGKIVRAGAVPQYDLIDLYGPNYFYQMNQPNQQEEPLIEVDGKLRYGLPGTPLFPSDAQGLTLKPTLRWLITSDRPAKIAAELDYITKGLRWDATYNVIAPAEDAPAGQRLEMVGWVNVTNQSGTDFHDASLQLMAGDISKLQNMNGGSALGALSSAQVMVNGAEGGQQPISQKSFDEYHLYDLHRTTSLLDHQSKQIEFLNAAEIAADRVYVYDGFKIDNLQNGMRYLQWNQENFGGGTSTNKKVWVMQEFKNSEQNHLGMPLPKGRMRFYRQETGGRLQFIGENVIDHTPKDETIRVFLGDAFDITGERTRTDFKTRQNGGTRTITETYKVVLKNAKSTAAKVRVVEHLYRTANWEISANTDPFVKRDSQTVEYNVEIPANGEKAVSYTVEYSW
jgi:hypothetical protein